jgi:hypothetical protein
MTYWSYTLGDMSQGMDETPIWIPQISMAIGSVLFFIAVCDHGLRLVLTGDHGLTPSPDAL